jgi:hypothetical protein
MEEFHSTVGVKAGDEGGRIMAFLADDKAKAQGDAWLVVEVGAVELG